MGKYVDSRLKDFVKKVMVVDGYEPMVIGYLECLCDFGYIDCDEYEKYIHEYIPSYKR